ncbi:MAG: hypothetical protein Q7S17_09060 [Xanthobacteraceae bacterium]|nr:hypothetical protein [Xanthobacteraceae bacterium]
MTHIDPGSDQIDPNAPPQNPPGNGAPAEAVAVDTEKFARRLGWRPEAEFSGAPASRRPKSFLSAADYIAKVEQEVPILRDRLRQQDSTIVKLESTVTDTARKVDEAAAVIRQMHESNKSANERAYKRARADLEREMDAAARTGDPAAYDDTKAKIARLDSEQAEQVPPPAKVNGVAPAAEAPPVMQTIPEVEVWKARPENKWFGADIVLNQAAIAYESTIDRNIPLADRLEKMGQWVEKKFGADYPHYFPGHEAEIEEPVSPPVPPGPPTNLRRRAPPRVASPGGGNEQPHDGLTYETMTAEEKQHCDYLVKTIKGMTREDYLRDYKR